jgi:lipopolysaccharide export LptBFGC system permease protein LptF
MKKIRNQDIASIIAILALVCHFSTLPIGRKCAVLQTRLSLLENDSKPSPELIGREKSGLNFYRRISRAFESAALLFAILSLYFCRRSIKAGESGAHVTLCVLVVIFLVASRMN